MRSFADGRGVEQSFLEKRSLLELVRKGNGWLCGAGGMVLEGIYVVTTMGTEIGTRGTGGVGSAVPGSTPTFSPSLQHWPSDWKMLGGLTVN
ncbi:hypothetical protein V2G26_015940 [Clonostachys chloroleuca]